MEQEADEWSDGLLPPKESAPGIINAPMALNKSEAKIDADQGPQKKNRKLLSKLEIEAYPSPQGQGLPKGNPSSGSKSGAKPDPDQAGPAKESSEGLHLTSQLDGAFAVEKPNLQWADVIGLEGAKEVLKIAAILPLKFPHLFTGNRTPWRSVLLSGPPGTGKTHLVQALSTEAQSSTFIALSPTTFLSRRPGDSEHLVRDTFEMARFQRPSIIFMDGIERLCPQGAEPETEGTRRAGKEFLVQMRGAGKNNDGVLVVGTTSVPWALDTAILNCFEKRVHVPLPDAAARKELFRRSLGSTPNSLTEEDFQALGERAEGCSGGEIQALVREAMMEPIRRVLSATHFCPATGPSPRDPNVITDHLLTPCPAGVPGAIEMTWADLDGNILLQPLVSIDDMLKSLEAFKPATATHPGETLKNLNLETSV